MDFLFTAEELAFREDVRAFFREALPADIRDKVRLGQNMAADDLRRSVLDALAARAEATSVIATAPSTPVAGDSPIVRRAKQRAIAAQA